MDDLEDIDRINLLMDDTPPEDFHVVNTQIIPGLEDLEIVRNLQMFTQVSRAKIPAAQFGSMPSKYFARLLQVHDFLVSSYPEKFSYIMQNKNLSCLYIFFRLYILNYGAWFLVLFAT